MRRKSALPLDEQQTRQLALKLQSRREHAAQELRRKLMESGAPRELAENVVESLQGSGLQSDRRYTEMLLRSRLAQHYGPLRIRSELHMAGIDDGVASEVLDEAAIDWEAEARVAWERKFGTPAESPQERQRQYRYLASHGFDSSQIRHAMRGLPHDSA